jgi:hypothetical protein
VRYRTTLLLFGPNNTAIPVPDEILASFGRGRRVPVVVTVNGYAYRTTTAPYTGQTLIPFNAAHRTATGLRGGEEIEVDLVTDDAPRQVDIPADLATAFEGAPEAEAFFATLSYTNRRSFTTWIEGAKKPETRVARVGKAVELLRAKQTR